MSSDPFRATDNGLDVYLRHFANECVAMQAELGLTQQEVDAILADQAAYAEALQALTFARSAYEGALVAKRQAREQAVETGRSIARRVHASGASADVVAKLGLKPRQPSPSRVQSFAPEALVSTAYTNGTTLLTWKSGGNTRGVVYQVEERLPSGRWRHAAMTTRRRLKLRDQTVGEPKLFRVRALRNETLSEPSNLTIVYTDALPPQEAAA
jgi:hypothetical protein